MYKTEGQADGCSEDAEVKENDARKVKLIILTLALTLTLTLTLTARWSSR
jgi:hypothetical protein